MSSYKTDKYKMRGMGGLLSLYGSACEEIEADYNAKKDAFLKAKKEYLECKDRSKRSNLKEIMIGGKGEMDKAKRKMKDVLENVSEAIKSASKTVSSKVMSPKTKAKSPKAKSKSKSPQVRSRILEDAVEEDLHVITPTPIIEEHPSSHRELEPVVEENDDIDSILSDGDSIANMPSKTDSERKTMHEFFKYLGIGGGKMEQYATEQSHIKSEEVNSDSSSSGFDSSSSDASTRSDTSDASTSSGSDSY